MDINNNDLYKKHDRLIQLKRETYEKIYTQCKNRIKLTSDAGELLCLFEIPEFVFGASFPIINIESCANYVMNKLTRANKHIKTIFVNPNIIFIDWRRERDMDPSKEYMPLIQHTQTSSQYRPRKYVRSECYSKSSDRSDSRSRSNRRSSSD